MVSTKTKKKADVFQVKHGSWKSKKCKTLRTALKLMEAIDNEQRMDGSGDIRFPETIILKNGRRLAGY
jgi:hypothetical protein